MATADSGDATDETDGENVEWHCLIGECDMHAPMREQVRRHAVRDHPFDELLSQVVERRETE